MEDGSDVRDGAEGVGRHGALCALFERGVDLVLVSSVEGIVEDVNPAVSVRLGWERDAVVGKPLLWLVHPEDLDAVDEAYARAATHGVDQLHIRLRSVAGTFLDFHWSAVPSDDGRTIVSIARLATEVRLIETQLRESERRFADIVSAAGEYLFELDDNCRYTFLTQRIEELLGRPVDDYVGQPFWDFVAPSEVDGVRAALQGSLQFRTRLRDFEFAVVDHEGDTRWHLIHGVPILDEIGRVRGFRGVGQDVTDRRLAAEALQRAKESAESANRSKSAFLANMSHELRTPMTAILGFTELLQDDQLEDRERDRHLTTIRRNGEHLLRLVNDILDLSKIEAGRFELDRRPCSVREGVNEVLRLLAVRSEGKGLVLGLSVDQAVPECVLTDEARVRQVLVNLIGNAIKFTEQGRIDISVSRRSDPGVDPIVLAFAVTDNGIGISPENIEKLFRPFQQADSSTTRRFGGTGLGLSISVRLARLLGGDITVESVLGSGSTFTLTIACSEVTPSPQMLAAGPPEAPKRGTDKLEGRVLLVEDGPDNQLLVSHILRKAGLAIEIVDNGLLACQHMEAVARGEAEPIDLVLMDMQMPVMDGYAATERLREAGETLPIVALTAHAMSGDRERCLQAGCDDFLTKPLDRKKLLALLAARIRPQPAPES